VLFKDGKAYDRIIGFEEVGNKDDFPTLALIRRLVRAKIITPNNKTEAGIIKLNKNLNKEKDEDFDY
jgi:hypothetical protein